MADTLCSFVLFYCLYIYINIYFIFFCLKMTCRWDGQSDRTCSYWCSCFLSGRVNTVCVCQTRDMLGLGNWPVLLWVWPAQQQVDFVQYVGKTEVYVTLYSFIPALYKTSRSLFYWIKDALDSCTQYWCFSFLPLPVFRYFFFFLQIRKKKEKRPNCVFLFSIFI